MLSSYTTSAWLVLKLLCLYPLRTHGGLSLVLSFVSYFQAGEYSWKLTTILGNSIAMESFSPSLCDRSSFRKGDEGMGNTCP
jgi:hypothetical protein